MKQRDYQVFIFAGIVLLYVVGQFVIGTWNPDDGRFHFDAPADADFLYYAAITNSVPDNFPPHNPAFAGVKLTQPYLQYYPAALLAKIINPYNAMRLLNVLYLVLFGLLLRRYFPGRYGFPLLILFTASTFGVAINAAGVDFIARGFTHVPFFLLLTVALYEKSLKWRLPALVGAAFVNGYLMLMVIPFLCIIAILEKKKELYYLLATGVLATALSALFISSEVTARPWHFIITESFYFDPIEIIKHAVPFIILSVLYRERRMAVLLVIAGVFGIFIHYNPFFPVFVIYFAGALMLAGGEVRIPKSKLPAGVIAVILFVGFVISAYQKYNPDAGDYYARYDDRIQGAVGWLVENTESSAVIAALTADERDLALIMEKRPVYLGYIGHLGHLGLDWKPRYENTFRLFSSGIAPPEVDYIFYGPVERRYFPNAILPFDTVYSDKAVVLYQVSAKR